MKQEKDSGIVGSTTIPVEIEIPMIQGHGLEVRNRQVTHIIEGGEISDWQTHYWKQGEILNFDFNTGTIHVGGYTLELVGIIQDDMFHLLEPEMQGGGRSKKLMFAVPGGFRVRTLIIEDGRVFHDTGLRADTEDQFPFPYLERFLTGAGHVERLNEHESIPVVGGSQSRRQSLGERLRRSGQSVLVDKG